MMVTAPAAQTTPADLREQARDHKRKSNRHRKQARLLMQKAEELEARTGIPVRIVPSSSQPEEAQNASSSEHSS